MCLYRRYVRQPDPTEEVEEEDEEENGSEENDEEDKMYKNQTNGLSGGKAFMSSRDSESHAVPLVSFFSLFMFGHPISTQVRMRKSPSRQGHPRQKSHPSRTARNPKRAPAAKRRRTRRRRTTKPPGRAAQRRANRHAAARTATPKSRERARRLLQRRLLGKRTRMEKKTMENLVRPLLRRKRRR